MGTAISSQADLGKRCTKCGEVKPLSEFRFRPSKGRYRPQCRQCEKITIKAYNRSYYTRNRDAVIQQVATYRAQNIETLREWCRAYSFRKHREWKRAALAVIGESCACCGESTFEFLTIDHVDNDGHIHRRQINQRNIYEWLAKVDYKTDFRLQTLCFNCNFAKRYNGECPHQRSEGSTTIPQGSTAKRPEVPVSLKKDEDIV